MAKQSVNLIILLILNMFIVVNSVNARMKCWVNNEGIKECGDTVPPEYTQQGYQELSKGGIIKDETERVKTKEELEKEKEKARALAREKEIAIKKQNYDKMLLDTYNSADEIDDAKINKIKTIESTIEYTKKRIIKIQSLLGNEKKSDEEKQNLEKQIVGYEKYIENKINEQKEVEIIYSKYLARYKELKGID